MTTSSKQDNELSALDGDTQPVVISQATATELLKSRCKQAYKVDPADSHFFHEDKPTQHQSWANGGYIGLLKNRKTMPTVDSGPPATILQDDHTLIYFQSVRPFHKAIKKEYKVEKYTVEPPTEGGRPECLDAISRMYVVDGGIYAIRYEGDPKVCGRISMSEMDATRFLGGEISQAFKWTGGSVLWHPFKSGSIADSQQSVLPL